MASTRRPREPDLVTPFADDEEDVVQRARATEDEEGNLVTSTENVRRVGAIDSESALENSRRRAAVKRKKSGEKYVSFNSDDIMTSYDGLVKAYGASALTIRMKRLTGDQVSYVIKNRPRNADDMYETLLRYHGQSAEAEYKIQFVTPDGQFKGTGRIVLPDTRPAHLRDQPMGYPPQQPPYGAPPQYGAQPAPQPAPPPAKDQFAELNAWRDYFLGLGFQPPGQQQAPAPQPPPPGTDMAKMREMAQWFESMGWRPPGQQQPPQPAPVPQQQQFVPQQPAVAAVPQPPAVTPPPGHELVFRTDTGWTIQPIQRRDLGGGYERPQPPYRPQPRQQYQPPPQDSQQPRSQMDAWRDGLTQMRQMRSFASEVQSVFGGGGSTHEPDDAPETTSQEDESGLRTKKIGDMDVIHDDEGKIQWGATLAVSAPKALKWLGELVDKVEEKNRREAEQARAPTQPPQQPYAGQQVHVQPGQQPPEGYRFVYEDQQPPPPQPQVVVTPAPAPQQGLPPPPQAVPPTIQETEAPPPGQRAWEQGG